MSLHKIRRPLRSHNLPRIRAVTMGAVGALLIGFLTTVSSNAAVGDGVFEQDGNAADDGDVTGADWNSIQGNGTPNNGSPAPFRTTGVLDDIGGTDEIFTGGGSKDDLDISSWQHSTGSVPDKDDITNAYAAAYSSGDDTIVNFGLDRFAQNGDANVGFWFLKDDKPETLPADGTFGMEHTVGDILVLSEFSSGGDVSSIRVLEWNPALATINGTLRELPLSGDPECDGLSTDTQDACGIANGSDITVDWPYQAKDRRSPSGTIPTAGFFEGAINLTQLLSTTDPRAQCFSTFLAETRSSTSVDATLKDFVLGEFALCETEVTITPSQDTNSIDESHTFTVTASYSVAGGTPQPIDNGHVDVTLTTNPTTMSYTLGTPEAPNLECDINPGEVHSTEDGDNLDDNGQCFVVIDSSTAGTITATASLSSDFGTDVTEETEEDEDGPATKYYLDGTLKWEKRIGSTTGALLGGASFDVCRISYWDSGAAPGTSGTLVSQVTDPVGGTPTAEQEAAYVCPTGDLFDVDDDSVDGGTDVAPDDADDTAGKLQLNNLPLGRYRIVETAAPAGFQLDPTPQYVDITATSRTPNAVVFVNQPLYKVIVLTCTTTGDLVDSTVGMETTAVDESTEQTKQTLTDAPSGLTEAQLCGLGGASYSPLQAGDYTPEVELPTTP